MPVRGNLLPGGCCALALWRVEPETKKGTPVRGPRKTKLRSVYSPGAMAPIGQASAQVPQSMQTFGSME